MSKSTNLSQEVFEDIIGQYTAVTLLSSALKKHRIAPAYLFAGPEGVGRGLTARRFLEGLLTGGLTSSKERVRLEKYNHPDLLWVEPTYQHQGKLITQSLAQQESINKRSTPQIRLEQIREVKAFLSKQPLEAKSGMVVIEDVEMMQEAAANALLKTLEEPGKGILILISERPERLLQTIRSRCQKIPFKSLNNNHLKQVLDRLKSKKSMDSSITIKAPYLVMISNGSPGKLLKNIQAWNELPNGIWDALKRLPNSNIENLSLARNITENLDVEQQLWLINLFQQFLWSKAKNPKQIEQLDTLRVQLIAYVQPRLAWEITLLKISQEF